MMTIQVERAQWQQTRAQGGMRLWGRLAATDGVWAQLRAVTADPALDEAAREAAIVQVAAQVGVTVVFVDTKEPGR